MRKPRGRAGKGAGGARGGKDERKRLEAEIRHFASFPQSNPSPVLELGSDGRIIYRNPAAEAVARGAGARDAGVFLPADIRTILASPPAEPLFREVEVGDRVFRETISAPPGFGTFRIFCIDVTEHRRLEEELRVTAEKLARAVSDKNELLGIAAHDLRSPLVVIAGFCEMLLRRHTGRIPADTVPILQKIHAHARNMYRLVDDLLDVSTIEAGKLVLHLETTDLAELLTNAVQLQRELAVAKNITLRCDVPGDLPRIVVDRNKIEQVVNNLLSNSIKFSPRDSAVTLTAARTPGEIGIEVRDDGVGISPERLPRIFEPFCREEGGGTAGERGFGLGLTIAHKIAEAHDARLTVESEVGRGSVFRFFLPVRDG